MDVMDIAKMMLAKKLGGDSAQIGNALGGLLGGGNEGGGLDLGNIVSGLQSKGLGDVAQSWLGDGENAEISAEQVQEVLGQESIAKAAAEMGTDEGSLIDGLKEALPQMVDKSSSGGSLLDSVGGVGGLANMAKKLF